MVRMSNKILPIMFLAALILATDLHAAAPTLSIATNPLNYGQNDKIIASSYPALDNVVIYINSTAVANATKNVNYTVCSNGLCLKPGTYAVTAYDTVSGLSTIQYLVVKPLYPSFTIQQSTALYAHPDSIIATSAFYNDSLSVKIDGQVVYTGNGTVRYTICSNETGVNLSYNWPCLPVGTHNVSVYDVTEGVNSTSNQTLTIKPVAPTVSLEYQHVKYGMRDNITAVPPLPTDQVEIRVSNSTIPNFTNSVQLAMGMGTLVYPICNSTQQPCLAPSNYSVYAYDESENANSSISELYIAKTGIKMKINATKIPYGLSDQITASAPNPNDSIAIYADGTQISPTGTGNVLYIMCDAVAHTSCLSAGTHTIYAHDSVENLSSQYVTVSITPVSPFVTISDYSARYSVPININGTAPYYNDSLSVLINNMAVANGTGKVSYTICANGENYTCLLPGTYSVWIRDNTEDTNSTPSSIEITGTVVNGTYSSTIASIPTTTALTPNQTRGGGQKGGSSGGISYAEIAGIIILVAILIMVALYLKRQRDEAYVPPHHTDLATQEQHEQPSEERQDPKDTSGTTGSAPGKD